MKYKSYPTYKPSDVEWIGNIPTHWEVKKMKWVCQVGRGASPRPIEDEIYFDEDGEYAWVRISDVTASNKYLTSTEQRLSALGKSKSVALEPGDIFLSIAGSVGKPIITAIKCCIHDGFVYFRNLKQNREFCYYVLSGGELYKGLGKLGTQLNLNTDTVANITIPVPPIWEQQAIATYLDNETTKIDAQINEKQRLIKLLQERRNTLISQFVTKGLDPTVEMKASDVEWIGEIPSHWEVVQLKFAITMNPEVLSENTDPDYTIQYVDIGNVDSNGRVVGSEELRFEDAPSRARRLVRHGDTIISTVRTYLKSIGFINSPPENLIVSTGFAVLRPHPNLHPPFLAWQVQSAWFIDTVVAYSEGIGYPAINPGQLASLPILIPPLAEQQTISDFLNQETDKIDRLIAINQQPIEKLQEYRASLVSAAVTGKLDLREQINDEAQYTWEF